MIKILNLYAGIGGNRKLWGGDIMVTAVEINTEIAKIYQDFFPNDKVIVADAHQYLLDHYKEFDFIWSSPPCPSHSRIRFMATKAAPKEEIGRTSLYKIYPDMCLYQEIIFLENYFEGKYCVENVIAYYEPLIKPQIYKKHFYWANFIIDGQKQGFRGHHLSIDEMQKHKGFDISGYDLANFKGRRKDQILRNCVEPEAGLYIFNCAFKIKQTIIGEIQ
jgi:DNA (cytosine-5)-methyltransferase 1